MMIAYFTFLALASAAIAAPGRGSRYDYDDFFFPIPFPSRTYPGTFAGAYAGVPSFPWFWNPWYGSVPLMPDLSQIKPWYEGDNVCQIKKVFDSLNGPDMKEFSIDGFSDQATYNSESEQCRGTNEKYVCIKRMQTTEGSKIEARKYECCFGFVRAPDGKPGCVENSGEKTAKDEPSGVSSTSNIFQLKDNYKYRYESGGRSKKSGVDSVPVQ